MTRLTMTPALTEIVAARFRALGEPARLQILNALRGAELTVTALAERTGMGQPNLSKHLRLLYALGFVQRRKEGAFVCYGLADPDVFGVCDTMCDRVAAEAATRGRLFSSP